ncbi:hypothetical protein F5141DRAFT_1065533 [Pisolithus sp. B1]|nr:hypothetical protein F5141DRAFT_1065533 [Pisolithus sp. B1]
MRTWFLRFQGTDGNTRPFHPTMGSAPGPVRYVHMTQGREEMTPVVALESGLKFIYNVGISMAITLQIRLGYAWVNEHLAIIIRQTDRSHPGLLLMKWVTTWQGWPHSSERPPSIVHPQQKEILRTNMKSFGDGNDKFKGEIELGLSATNGGIALTKVKFKRRPGGQLTAVSRETGYSSITVRRKFKPEPNRLETISVGFSVDAGDAHEHYGQIPTALHRIEDRIGTCHLNLIENFAFSSSGLVHGTKWNSYRAHLTAAERQLGAKRVRTELLGTPAARWLPNALSTTQMLSTSFKSCIGMPSWTDEFLRQSLLSEDIIDVHFHLFSRRSKSRVLYPRMLNTNTALLKNSAKYFKDVFSSDSAPSHAIIFNVRTTDSIFDGLELDDYGYGSDSISRMRTMASLS